MRRDVYEDVKAETIAGLSAAGSLDGLLLANHGALEIAGLGRHGDTDFVEAIRAAIGPLPLGIAFDLHGNLTPEIVAAGDVFSALRTAPHRDDLQTGARAADHLLRLLRGGRRPAKAFVRIPMLVVGEAAVTTHEPAKSLYAALARHAARPGVTDAILMVGFAFQDSPYAGMSVVVTADDAATASRVAAEIAEGTWASRSEFRFPMRTDDVGPGLDAALASTARPFFVSDASDNTTAGAPGDLTVVLQALLDRNPEDAVVAGITAPAFAARCREAGVGAAIEFDPGAEHISVPRSMPRMVQGTVLGCGEKLVLPGFQPYRTEEGGWASLRLGKVIATFHERPIGITTPHHFAAMGIDPVGHGLYVVKLGYLHPQLEDIAADHLLLVGPGAADPRLAGLEWRHMTRPVFPLDTTMQWSAAGSVVVS
jgi:microcystin degradation protein MlrC